ncbi:YraN family protein [Marinicella gelatinilytica]|uniref:YraN family protein n=1 Tax=Marinicella gelatinilytica TaxID=2996017 RepID=UPI002260AEF3|nr:YraN family protein [Marinicella gelatinilytica]MCX7544065.1 YraN family protein [Marinicella gelatinilytica]
MGHIRQWWRYCHRLIKGDGATGINRWERLACTYLQQQGLKLVTGNFRTKAGEVDLIMEDSETLVFVEVRYRKHQQWGGAEASVTNTKQQRICKAAAAYLQKNNLTNRCFCRFDVVAINGHLTPPQIHWIKDAFQQTQF